MVGIEGRGGAKTKGGKRESGGGGGCGGGGNPRIIDPRCGFTKRNEKTIPLRLEYNSHFYDDVSIFNSKQGKSSQRMIRYHKI